MTPAFIRSARPVSLGMGITLCLGFATLAAAYLPISIKELTRRAVAIAEIRVISKRVSSPLNPEGVRTFVKVEVLHCLKGQLPEQFEIDTPGGTMGSRVFEAPDTPEFELQEKAIVFLKEPTKGHFLIQDLGLGKFTITTRNGQRVVENELNPRALQGELSNGSELHGRSIPYPIFDRLVTAYVSGRGDDREAARLAVKLPPVRYRPSGGKGKSEQQIGEKRLHVEFPWPALAAVALALACFFYRRRHSTTQSSGFGASPVILVALCLSSAIHALGGGVVEGFTTTGSTWNLDARIFNVVEDQRVIWTPVRVSLSNQEPFTLVEQGFDRWENVPLSRIAFKRQAQGTNPGKIFHVDSQNAVSWDAAPSRDFDKNTLAITFTIFDAGSTLDSDIIFNDRDFIWTDDLVFTTALHEIGHVVGLGHVEDPEAVMFPTSQGLTELSADEITAVQTLYPDPDDKGSAGSSQPVAAFAYSPSLGSAPLEVTFDAASSFAADGFNLVSFAWAFGDGQTSAGASVSHAYAKAGVYTAELTVTDNQMVADSTSRVVQVGNRASARNGNFNVDFVGDDRDRFLIRIQSDALRDIRKHPGSGGDPALGALSVGGALFTFKFDAGKARSLKDDQVRFTVRDEVGEALIKVIRVDLEASFEALGAQNKDIKGQAVSVPVFVSIPDLDVHILVDANFSYRARQHRTGRGKI